MQSSRPSEKLFQINLNAVDASISHYFAFVVPNPKKDPERASVTFALCDENAKVTLAQFVYDNCNRKKAHVGVGIHRGADGHWFFRPIGESSPETEFGDLAEHCVEFTKEPIWVWVNLIGARGLRAFDANGKSDPYVIVKCNRQVFKTDTAKRTLTPTWNNSFRIAFWNNEDLQKKDILFEMFDWDSASKDDFMGVCSILVEEVLKVAPADYDQWIKLTADERIKATKVQGELHVGAKILRPVGSAAAAAPAASTSSSATTTTTTASKKETK